jgi:hypothetical protein
MQVGLMPEGLFHQHLNEMKSFLGTRHLANSTKNGKRRKNFANLSGEIQQFQSVKLNGDFFFAKPCAPATF